MNVEVTIRHEDRRSLALKVTPGGILVLLPGGMDPESGRAQRFIEAGLARLGEPEPPGGPLERAALRTLVDVWAERLGVEVGRVQVRPMRRKWASFSSKGSLTLARDLLSLPVDLIEYAVCHELLHQRFPDHGKGFRAMLTAWIPDWRERERRLMVQGLPVLAHHIGGSEPIIGGEQV